MELDLGTNVGNNKTNEIEEFTNELNKVLQEDKILVYQGYDSRKFTNVNEDKIMRKVTNAIDKILKIAEFIKKSINKFKQK